MSRQGRIGGGAVRVAAFLAGWTVHGLDAVAQDRMPAADGRAVEEVRRQVLAPDGLQGLCGGEPCDAVARGLFHFFDRSPDGIAGNGRACGDCHMA
ncbi:MAG: hypothetical protein ABW221_06515, partial [Vicinamibacteria bacterium]